MIDLLAPHSSEPVVAAAVELENVELSLEQGDERQKPLAVQPVLVKLVGGAVRGRHHHDPGIEQCGKQAIEDHRVGDVLNLEFVKAEERRLGSDLRRHLGDRLAGSVPPLLFDAIVHFEHKGVEMNPPLVLARRGGEEEIHQHRLATPNRSA